MKKKKNNQYDKFKSILLKVKTEKQSYYRIGFKGVEEVYRYWDNLSSRSKRMVMSDSRWNHYPMHSYTAKSKKRFGFILGEIVSRAVMSGDPKQMNDFVGKAEGVFALYALDKTTSKNRIKMAKRLASSPDARIRTRCARILPHNLLSTLLEDKNYNVRNIALMRVGMDNCYKKYIPNSPTDRDNWYGSWLGRQAIRLASKSELEPLIEKAKDMSKDDVSRSDLLLATLVERLTPEEALYMMNLSSENAYLQRAFESKFGIS